MHTTSVPNEAVCPIASAAAPRLGIMRVGGPVLAGLFLAILVVGVVVRDVNVPFVRVVDPSVFAIASAADIATTIVLLSSITYRRARTSIYALSAVYGFSAVVAFINLMSMPLSPSDIPLLHLSAQSTSYLYAGWKTELTIAAGIYSVLRGRAKIDVLSMRAIVGTALAWAIGAFVLTELVLVNSSSLPPLLEGSTFTPLFRFVVEPGIALCCIGATIAVMRIRDATEIDHAFAYTILAVAVEGGLVAIGGHIHSAPWYFSRVLFVGTAIFVLVTTIHMLLRSREQLRLADEKLWLLERESGRNAERIRNIWQIAASPPASTDARIKAILDIGARTIRPGVRMLCYVSRIDGSRVRIEAAIESDGTAARPSTHVDHPLDGSIEALLARRGRACAWEDIAYLVENGALRADLQEMSCIGAPFKIAQQQHFLVFCAAGSVYDAPFAEDDLAFVEVLAAFAGHYYANQQQRERLRYHIEHDNLTGLIGRGPFRAKLRESTMNAESFALALIDIDHFRAVNETAGHLIGDEVLVEVAATLDGVDERDIVARTSGDHFSIIIRNVTSTEDAQRRVTAYADLFRKPFHTGDREGTRLLSITASIGTALFPADGTTSDDLLRAAEVAIDAAKERGGNMVVHFEPSMSANRHQLNLQIAQLSDAIDHDELILYYQPTFDIATRAITGAEALLRWNHPLRGLVPPAEFITFAEKNGLIGRLSRWVVDRVIHDLSSMAGIPRGFRCFFNLAAAQLDDLAFITELEQRMRFAPRLAEHLGVEITETVAMANTENSMFALNRFHRMGLRVAIDDFGTGYSSLSYLKRLPVDIIKIDRTFLSDLPLEPKDAALYEMLLQIARRFEITALAEGIETVEQLQWLTERGCAFGQGYLIAKPMPFDALVNQLYDASNEKKHSVRSS